MTRDKPNIIFIDGDGEEVEKLKEVIFAALQDLEIDFQVVSTGDNISERTIFDDGLVIAYCNTPLTKVIEKLSTGCIGRGMASVPMSNIFAAHHPRDERLVVDFFESQKTVSAVIKAMPRCTELPVRIKDEKSFQLLRKKDRRIMNRKLGKINNRR